ncbi:MAG: ATP-dependent DNA helicase [Pseudomonadota bacterium]
MSDLLLSILGDNGSLKNVSPGFVSRASQIAMAEAVEEAIHSHSTLVVEAGTGIGKTFAYLIPALLADKKTLVSTGTKNLQDQLFHKDLPTLKKLLAINKKIVLLKGRSNYACLYRLDAPEQHQLFETKEGGKEFANIQRWSAITSTGDLSELENLAEDSNVLQQVVSTTESCLGNTCEFYEKCFVVKARKEAMSADVVVVNHHLFFADLSLKEESLGKLLPDVETVIFDEAHQLYDAASSFLSQRFSSRQLLLLIKDVQTEYAMLGADHPDILRLTLSLKLEVANFRLALGENGKRDAWFEIAHQKDVKKSLENLCEQLTDLTRCLAEQSQRSKGLENAWERASEFNAFLGNIVSDAKNSQGNFVFWFETFLTGFMLYKTPIDFSVQLSAAMNDPKKAWIYASATLDAGFGVDHFTKPLGIKPNQTLILESPFNYAEQARLYFPHYLPDVTNTSFVPRWMESIIPLLEAANGRTFLLFTSHRAMKEAYDYLRQTNFTLLMQGQTTKHALLDQFKTSERAVLLGTSSFWQGVDVQGTALCCVCIDKLPFASPGDPVTKARINAYKSSGRDPFYEYQLPHAVIMLKQGVGRLIRSETDKGVLVIGDMRLLTRNYGEAFLKAMPKALLVRDENKVTAFLQGIT